MGVERRAGILAVEVRRAHRRARPPFLLLRDALVVELALRRLQGSLGAPRTRVGRIRALRQPAHPGYDGRFRAMMRFQVERAHRLYDESWPGIGLLPPDSRFGVAAAARVYRGILDKLVANDYDAYTRRAHLRLREKVARLPRLWWDLRHIG